MTNATERHRGRSLQSAIVNLFCCKRLLLRHDPDGQRIAVKADALDPGVLADGARQPWSGETIIADVDVVDLGNGRLAPHLQESFQPVGRVIAHQQVADPVRMRVAL